MNKQQNKIQRSKQSIVSFLEKRQQKTFQLQELEAKKHNNKKNTAELWNIFRQTPELQGRQCLCIRKQKPKQQTQPNPQMKKK